MGETSVGLGKDNESDDVVARSWSRGGQVDNEIEQGRVDVTVIAGRRRGKEDC